MMYVATMHVISNVTCSIREFLMYMTYLYRGCFSEPAQLLSTYGVGIN